MPEQQPQEQLAQNICGSLDPVDQNRLRDRFSGASIEEMSSTFNNLLQKIAKDVSKGSYERYKLFGDVLQLSMARIPGQVAQIALNALDKFVLTFLYMPTIIHALDSMQLSPQDKDDAIEHVVSRLLIEDAPRSPLSATLNTRTKDYARQFMRHHALDATSLEDISQMPGGLDPEARTLRDERILFLNGIIENTLIRRECIAVFFSSLEGLEDREIGRLMGVNADRAKEIVNGALGKLAQGYIMREVEDNEFPQRERIINVKQEDIERVSKAVSVISPAEAGDNVKLLAYQYPEWSEKIETIAEAASNADLNNPFLEHVIFRVIPNRVAKRLLVAIINKRDRYRETALSTMDYVAEAVDVLRKLDISLEPGHRLEEITLEKVLHLYLSNIISSKQQAPKAR